MLVVEAFVVLYQVGFRSLSRQSENHTENTEGNHPIDQDIGQCCGISHGRTRQYAQQKKAHVGDRRISQHTLDIFLGNSNYVAQNNRKQRRRNQHLLPSLEKTLQAFCQQSEYHCAGRKLGRSSKKQGSRCWRTLVDVRNPHMEWHGTDFEQ